MAILGVDDFKSKLTGGGARPNLFKATLNFPLGITTDNEKASFMCKAASLPSSVIAPIMVPFRGRQLQIAGDRTFEPWTVTIINDTDMSVRNAFEKWMNEINNHTTGGGLTNPASYDADMSIEQLDKAGNSLKRYDIKGVWPTNVSAIELSYDTADTIEEFTVELQVTYWESTGITS
tara:strand:- start:78 stop:608 length:531 start_codon:yes stop_codon:yes gene_type:complete